MGLESYVDFYGRVDDATLVDVLNTAEVCVNPDKPTEMNNLSTMNKIMEYMALGKPIVQYDLLEGRVSAQESSLYAEGNNPRDFAEKILRLLDDAGLRERMGELGRQRVAGSLAWEHEAPRLLQAYELLFSNSKA
jgi:glycosyltransferase involved in cell wall biosynthesis